jgi:hypothetical protein
MFECLVAGAPFRGLKGQTPEGGAFRESRKSQVAASDRLCHCSQLACVRSRVVRVDQRNQSPPPQACVVSMRGGGFLGIFAAAGVAAVLQVTGGLRCGNAAPNGQGSVGLLVDRPGSSVLGHG